MTGLECEHGEPKGAEWCALCRWAGVGRTTKVDVPKVRNSDPATSRSVVKESMPRQGTQAYSLLIAHMRNPNGLTDEEAAEKAGLNPRSEFRTRCSTLRNLGLIADTLFTRKSSMGRDNIVRVITPAGIEWIKKA